MDEKDISFQWSMKRLKDEFERDCGEYARRLQSQGPEAGEDLKAACALVFEKAFLPMCREEGKLGRMAMKSFYLNDGEFLKGQLFPSIDVAETQVDEIVGKSAAGDPAPLVSTLEPSRMRIGEDAMRMSGTDKFLWICGSLLASSFLYLVLRLLG